MDDYDRLRHAPLPITEPVPGNHDYGTTGAAGYYRYFGRIRDREPDGYYSYDLGSWHLVALNSAICPCGDGMRPRRPAVRVAAERSGASSDAFVHARRIGIIRGGTGFTYQNASWTEDYEWLRSKPFWDLPFAALRRRRVRVVTITTTRGGCRWMRTATADPSGIRRS